MKRTLKIAAGAALVLGAAACSLDIIPVHFSRINSAKRAEDPLLRGPEAPGAFKHAWIFKKDEGGLLFDPNELVLVDGALRFSPKRQGEREAQLVTSAGPHFEALDSVKEITAPENRAQIRYQLSRDNATWYYRAQDSWKLAGPSSAQSNTAEDLKPYLGKFHSEVGTGTLYLRVFFRGALPGVPLVLRSIEVTGVQAPVDGWN